MRRVTCAKNANIVCAKRLCAPKLGSDKQARHDEQRERSGATLWWPPPRQKCTPSSPLAISCSVLHANHAQSARTGRIHATAQAVNQEGSFALFRRIDHLCSHCWPPYGPSGRALASRRELWVPCKRNSEPEIWYLAIHEARRLEVSPTQMFSLAQVLSSGAYSAARGCSEL